MTTFDYDLGDTVWVMYENKPTKMFVHRISAVRRDWNKHNPREFNVYCEYYCVLESTKPSNSIEGTHAMQFIDRQLFSSKEQLMKNVFEDE